MTRTYASGTGVPPVNHAQDTRATSRGRIVAIVPARMGASRFPGKPVAPLLGRPMIEHVWRRAMMCNTLDGVFIATCDDSIRKVVEGFGGKVIMTSSAHERASDRVAEAAADIEADIVVMIQGDEPMITPQMIDAAVAPMIIDRSLTCVNLVRRIQSRTEYLDPNTIKVVMNVHRDALYFSRSPIPAIDFPDLANGSSAGPAVFKQVCVIPFRRDYLSRFAELPQTALERAESIDMLRIIEQGGRIRLVETEANTHAVDTPEDLKLVAELMKGDPLIPQYEERVEVTK